jgi:hypothetical protein
VKREATTVTRTALASASSGARHAAAGLGAVAEHLGTDLTVVVIVLFTLVGTLLTEVGTLLGQILAVGRVASHVPGVQGGVVGDVPAESDAPGHVHVLVETRVGTPLTDRGGLEAVLDAVALFVVQVIDLGGGFGE